MAKTESKGKLQDRINKENAREASRYAKVKERGARGTLPAGIEDGVAKLTRVDFDVIENGPYAGSQRFYCHGVCVEPTTFEGKKSAGLLVQPRMITLDDVKSNYGDTSFAENVAKAEERLKKLGFPTEDFEDLEEDTNTYFNTAGDMYFYFRTWTPEDSDRVIHIIEGPANYSPTVKDDVEEVQEEVTANVTATDDGTPHYENGVNGYNTIDDLASKADNGDEAAQLEIADEAEKVGVNPENPDYDSWKDVVEAVKSVKSTTNSKVVESGLDPKVGDVYGYKPPRARKEKDCEVVEVNGQKVTLKSLEDDTVYEAVSVSQLLEIA